MCDGSLYEHMNSISTERHQACSMPDKKTARRLLHRTVYRSRRNVELVLLQMFSDELSNRLNVERLREKGKCP